MRESMYKPLVKWLCIEKLRVKLSVRLISLRPVHLFKRTKAQEIWLQSIFRICWGYFQRGAQSIWDLLKITDRFNRVDGKWLMDLFLIVFGQQWSSVIRAAYQHLATQIILVGLGICMGITDHEKKVKYQNTYPWTCLQFFVRRRKKVLNPLHFSLFKHFIFRYAGFFFFKTRTSKKEGLYLLSYAHV